MKINKKARRILSHLDPYARTDASEVRKMSGMGAASFYRLMARLEDRDMVKRYVSTIVMDGQPIQVTSYRRIGWHEFPRIAARMGTRLCCERKTTVHTWSLI